VLLLQATNKELAASNERKFFIVFIVYDGFKV